MTKRELIVLPKETFYIVFKESATVNSPITEIDIVLTKSPKEVVGIVKEINNNCIDFFSFAEQCNCRTLKNVTEYKIIKV